MNAKKTIRNHLSKVVIVFLYAFSIESHARGSAVEVGPITGLFFTIIFIILCFVLFGTTHSGYVVKDKNEEKEKFKNEFLLKRISSKEFIGINSLESLRIIKIISIVVKSKATGVYFFNEQKGKEEFVSEDQIIDFWKY